MKNMGSCYSPGKLPVNTYVIRIKNISNPYFGGNCMASFIETSGTCNV